MNKKIKSTAFILAIVMIFTLLPVSTIAQDSKITSSVDDIIDESSIPYLNNEETENIQNESDNSNYPLDEQPKYSEDLNLNLDGYNVLQNDTKKNSTNTSPYITTEPLIVNRSNILNKTFMSTSSWNLDMAWSTYRNFQMWKDAGIVDMLSQIIINGKNITPQDGDDYCYSQMYSAMGGGSTSLINKLSSVAVLVQKTREVPSNLPLNEYGQLIKENNYTSPYKFESSYSVNYSSHEPLFENQFILIDDCRQVTFVFEESKDGKTHGHFTDTENIIRLADEQDMMKDIVVPNNVIGVTQGLSLNDLQVGIPAFKLDEGWKIKEIQDSEGQTITEKALKDKKINDNITYTIVLQEDIPEIIDVVVPAIWYPVDKDTNQIITELNPIPTYPNMYERPEVAKLNDDGVYQIDYMGVPKPKKPGNWSANNFMHTSSLLFTDRFHRVVAHGYGTWELDDKDLIINDKGHYWQPGSTVRWLKYGDFVDVAPFNDTVQQFHGLLGINETAYQEGETLKLYIAAKPNANLSDPTFKSNTVEIAAGKSDSEVRQYLIDNIEKVIYLDLDKNKNTELDLNMIDTIYLYQYDPNDESKGNFITDEIGNYKNFMLESFYELPAGKYEAVFPIYWQKNMPDMYNSCETFSRNRYKVDDTFHFSVLLENTYTVTYTDGVDDEEIFKDQVYKDIAEGNKTPPFEGVPEREGYKFKGWAPEIAETVTGNVTYVAQWEKIAEEPTDPTDPTDPTGPTGPTRPTPTETVTIKPSQSEKDKSTTPKTGESMNSMLPIILSLLVVILTICVSVIKKKNKNQI